MCGWRRRRRRDRSIEGQCGYGREQRIFRDVGLERSEEVEEGMSCAETWWAGGGDSGLQRVE
jgi:hypothetical protein